MSASAFGPGAECVPVLPQSALAVRFSNRPFGVKRFQTIHHQQRRCRSRARSNEERVLIDKIEQVRDLRTRYRQYEQNAQTVKAYEAQILSLSTIFDALQVGSKRRTPSRTGSHQRKRR